MRFRRATAVAAVLALAAALAAAPDQAAQAKNDNAGGPPGQVLKGQGQGQGQGQGKGGKPEHAGKPDKGGKADKRGDDDRDYGDYRDRDRDRDRDYRRDYRDEDVVDEFWRYRRDRGDRTPDYLRNPSALPPGIAMNLQRGKPLPPGIAKKVGDDELLRRLPRSYDRSEWYAAGDRLIEYDPVNEAIIHVIEGALYGR
jgi:hypothetical protein